MVLGPQIHRSVESLAAVQTKKYQLALKTHVSVMIKKGVKYFFVMVTLNIHESILKTQFLVLRKNTFEQGNSFFQQALTFFFLIGFILGTTSPSLHC